MKHKLLLFAFLIIISGRLSAQTEKGQFYLGGNLSYNFNSFGSTNTYNFSSGYTIYNTSNIANFSISPAIGFFIGNKWSIGLQPTFSRSSGTETSSFYSYTTAADNYTNSDHYHNTILGLALEVRYYAMISDKFGFFPEFGVGTLNNGTYFKYGTFSIGATPNFVYFPTSNIGINLGFGGIAYNLDYQTKDHTINASLNSSITFGLNYFWGKN